MPQVSRRAILVGSGASLLGTGFAGCLPQGTVTVVMIVPSLSVAGAYFGNRSWTWALSCQSAAPVGLATL